jgi:hypothetical protein
MSNNKAEITDFGVVGKLNGEDIHYKQGQKNMGTT